MATLIVLAVLIAIAGAIIWILLLKYLRSPINRLWAWVCKAIVPAVPGKRTSRKKNEEAAKLEKT